MSVKCPSCGAPVDHDFGVTSCEKCAVVLFVDFDGKVQISTPESVAEMDAPAPVKEDTVSAVTPMMPVMDHLPDSLSPEEFLATNPGLAPEPEALNAAESEAPAFNFEPAGEFQLPDAPLENAEYNFDAPLDSQLGEDVSFEMPPAPLSEFAEQDEAVAAFAAENAESDEHVEVVAEAPAPAAETNMDWFENTLDDNLETAASAPKAPVNQVVDFSDVVDFANNAELDNNALVYKLRIEGIDHKDIRRKVESVLSDPKLNFHMKDLIAKIKNGRLDLFNLSPVRASVIASRLREENVRFYWSQGVFDSDGGFNENAS